MKSKRSSENPSTWLALLALALGWRSDRNYCRLPKLQKNSRRNRLPSLSIIVPARNEEENLKRLLPSLQRINYPGESEIIVVDDNSQDNTAGIVHHYHAKLVRAGEPAKGCFGKQNACHQGAVVAKGTWLLFTDADTLHAADGPAGAVSYVLDNKLDGLSTFLEQRFFGSMDRLVLTAAFAGLFAAHRTNQATLNGQFILIHRDVYLRCGGFLAVGDQMLDDLAFADLVNKMGFKVPLVRAEHFGKVYMYDDTRELWQGISRLGSDSLRWTGIRSLLTVLYITIMTLPLFVLMDFLKRQTSILWLLISWFSSSLSVMSWSRRFGSGFFALLAPLGAFFVMSASVWGLLSKLFGRKLIWKERRV